MLTRIPASFAAGDTVIFQQTLPDYPATAGWSLSYTLISSSGVCTFTAATLNSDYLITILSSVTAGYAPGAYSWAASVSRTGERHGVGRGSLNVLPNPATAIAGDIRTHVKRTLDAIEATIEGDATAAQLRMSIDGSAMERKSSEQLLLLRGKYLGYYRQELAAERIRNGQSSQSLIQVRF